MERCNKYWLLQNTILSSLGLDNHDHDDVRKFHEYGNVFCECLYVLRVASNLIECIVQIPQHAEILLQHTRRKLER